MRPFADLVPLISSGDLPISEVDITALDRDGQTLLHHVLEFHPTDLELLKRVLGHPQLDVNVMDIGQVTKMSGKDPVRES